MKLAYLFKELERFSIDNSPAILTAIGVVGTLSTAYLTGKASYKANELMEDEAERRMIAGMEDEPWPTKEKVELVWKLYLPAAGSMVITLSAIIGANRISSRRAAGLAAAYSLSERAFSEYKEKVVEKVGEKKEQSYRDEVARDRLEKNPVNDNTVLITDNGEVLCYDHFTGRYFKSSMEALKSAENEVNSLILNQGYASVSDLYDILGLPVTSFSDEVGWNTDRMLKMVYSTVLSPDGRPCISIDFDLHPHRKYSHFAGE